MQLIYVASFFHVRASDQKEMIYPAWGFGSSAVYCHTAADHGRTSKDKRCDCVCDMKKQVSDRGDILAPSIH